jgi:hypothetical protein
MEDQLDGTQSNPKDCQVSAAGSPPRLLDQVRNAIRVKHYSIRTEIGGHLT